MFRGKNEIKYLWVELKKKINQENDSKQITIKRTMTIFENKLKKSNNQDEIKNKIELEITNVNKTIADKRR